jgi:teichuronic acid biosynthesis glycosyltransferase TuaH
MPQGTLRTWGVPSSTCSTARTEAGRSVVVCSLEAWDDVWRRNQIFLDHLLRKDPQLRALFVEPAVDLPFELLKRRRPGRSGLRQLGPDPRVWLLRPKKLLPRVLARGSVDRHMATSVARAVERLGMPQPLLWVNDVAYAGLAEQVAWPVVYDVTDDWLLFADQERHLERLRRDDARLLGRADEVVVVSPALAASRGAVRGGEVHVIGCGVDFEHFRRPRPRPGDLPGGKVALYVGTLHDQRVDVALCAATAQAVQPARLVFVGPNCLDERSTRRLRAAGCELLGPRPYQDVPAYYQHADLVVVPHLVTPFTESLDPIKGYECLAVGRPALCTPIAGMRDLGPPIEVAPPERFPERARELLQQEVPSRPRNPATWAERAEAFAAVLESAREKRASSSVT